MDLFSHPNNCTGFFRYGLSAEEANDAVQLAQRHQVGEEPIHPPSLLDIWSPGGLLPTENEERTRQCLIREAANVRSDVSTVDALVYISGRLRRQLEACKMDNDWAKVFRKELTKLEGVVPGNLNLLVQYHTLMQKTGRGWTYARSVKEMVVTDPYHPKILTSLRDHMTSRTQLMCESLDNYDPDKGQLDENLAAMIGSGNKDFKQIGILQFFAQAYYGGEPLKGPTSQGTIPVFTDWDNPIHGFRPQEESDRLLNEDEFHGTLIQEVFTRTNTIRKLYEIRPIELSGMCFAQWLCLYRHVKRGTQEYSRLLEELRRLESHLGPLCEKTMIAGALEMAPKFLMLPNDQMVRLRDSRPKIVRLVVDHQVLTVKTKILLFGRWNRLEEALQDPDQDTIKQCDAVRLLLFPASTHTSE